MLEGNRDDKAGQRLRKGGQYSDSSEGGQELLQDPDTGSYGSVSGRGPDGTREGHRLEPVPMRIPPGLPGLTCRFPGSAADRYSLPLANA